MFGAADQITTGDFFCGGRRRAVGLGAGAGNQGAAFDRRLEPFLDLPVAGHGVDHHQGVVMDLKAVRGRWIAVGQMFVDEKKTQWIIAVQTEPKAAAPLVLVEIGEQPAFAVKIADVFERRRKVGVECRRARRDAFFDQGVDALNEAVLFRGEAEVQWRGSLLYFRRGEKSFAPIQYTFCVLRGGRQCFQVIYCR